MFRIAIAALAPAHVFGWIALAMGGLSVAAVFEAATGFRLPDPFAWLRAAYAQMLEATVGTARIVYEPPLAWLSAQTGFDLEVPPIWTHVFVILGVYFFREAAVNLREGHRHSAIFNTVVGAACALGASVAIAALTRAPHPAADTLACLAVVVAAFVYHQIGTIWDATVNRALLARSRNLATPSWGAHYLNGLRRGGVRALVGSALAIALMQAPFVRALPEPSLLVALMLVLAFALYWLADGVRDARLIRGAGERLEAAWLRSAHTQLGLDMLRPFIGLTIILLASVVYRGLARLRG